MEAEIISNYVNPLSRDYLSKLPHHVLPCMNLHRVLPQCEEKTDSVSRLLLKPLPYPSSIPVPLTPLSTLTRKGLNGIDPATNLIREKIKWQLKKEKILKIVRKDRKNISGKVIKRAVKMPLDSKAVVPRGVVLLAQHLDRDPDPYFSGVCNWYYTGGTLATLKHNDSDYLLHASPSKLNNSRIVDGKLFESSAFDLESGDPIHQIVSNSRGAAVRQRSCVNVFSINNSDDDGLQLSPVHSVTDIRLPFLSVALPDDSISTYGTLSNSGLLRLWDIEYGKKCKLMHQVEPGDGVTVTDSWGMLQFLDKRTLLMASRCCLHVFDVRSGVKENQLPWCPRKVTEPCEQLSYVTRSRLRDNVVYVATSHHLLSLDLRQGFSQRWTHMMAAPPLFGFTQVMEDQSEMICLGSQVLSDCVTVVNSWRGEEPLSLFKPSCVPSPAKALHLARQQGLCLDPTLTQRCTQSMTGLSFLPAENGLHIVRQSATDDIFIQQVSSTTKTRNQLTEKELASYSEWCQPTLSLHRDQTTLSVTEVKDFTPVFKALMSDTPLEQTEEACVNTTGSWQLSKKYLEDCVDMLAGRMLAVWEVEDEEEWAQLEEEDTLQEQDPAERVMNWLDTTTTDDKNFTNLPTVTSTPYPVATVPRDPSPTPYPVVTLNRDPSPTSPQEPDLWLPPAAHTPRRTVYDPADHMLSPPSSGGYSSHRRKKQKVFGEAIATTPPRQPPSTRKPQSSAKKKFVPGF